MNKTSFYSDLSQEIKKFISTETDWIANFANISAFLFQNLEDINWAGFYLLNDGELVLGPFQGKPAVSRIKIGEGVCGKAAQNNAPLLVDDVCSFGGHIACDPDSRSECVIPIYRDGEIAGVLDMDSPKPSRFTEDDLAGLQNIVDLISS